MSDEERRKLIKEAFKEAQKEWLDERFAEFGKWSVGAIAAASTVALGYFLLWANGWIRH